MLPTSRLHSPLCLRRSHRLRLLLVFPALCTLALFIWLFIGTQKLDAMIKALPISEQSHNIGKPDIVTSKSITTTSTPPEFNRRPMPVFGVPPIYESYYDEERRLPQHNASLPYPEGKNGRYLWVSNQVWGLGWNNFFQTYYMLALMSYLSNRAFVFRPYVWDLSEESFVEYYGRTLPSRIPLTVILSGPMAGGPLPPSVSPATPRAVSEEYFHTICPPERIKRLSVEEISKDVLEEDAMVIMDKYAKVLRDEVQDGCVQLEGTEHPFDWRILGTPRILAIWPTLSSSPIMTGFSWSPLILSALETNTHILTPSVPPKPESEAESHLHPNLSSTTPFPSLLAIHIRRGDYATHCHLLANWSSTYMGWAQHPDLPASDLFVPPPGGGLGDNTPENRRIYMKHCWPTVEEIVGRVGEVRELWEKDGGGPSESDDDLDPDLAYPSQRRRFRKLTHIHIMTNAEPDFLSSLLAALNSHSSPAGRWQGITSGTDLELSLAQSYVEQAVDMAIGERAGVFIGNGFSSLSANVIMLRMARGQPMDSNGFW